MEFLTWDYNVITINPKPDYPYIEVWQLGTQIGNRELGPKSIQVYNPLALTELDIKWFATKTAFEPAEISSSVKIFQSLEGHILLEGEDKYLPLIYNPEITNLKWNYIDTITSTLGSPYPFIIRNGQVKHRTFTLGGMLSYEIDLPINNLFSGYQFISQIEIDNIRKELSEYSIKEQDLALNNLFKDRVITWLQDGNPKTLISEQEGIINVNLSNFSWIGNKTLGRYNYSFTCTATEISDPPNKTVSLARTNLLDNASLTNNLAGWTYIGFNPSFTTKDGEKCLQIIGEQQARKNIYQNILNKIDTNNLAQKYSFSAEIKLDLQSKGSGYRVGLYIEGYDAEGKWINILAKPIELSQNWQKVSGSFVLSETTSNISELRAFIYANYFSGDLYAKNVKLERGSFATSWTPSLND